MVLDGLSAHPRLLGSAPHPEMALPVPADTDNTKGAAPELMLRCRPFMYLGSW